MLQLNAQLKEKKIYPINFDLSQSHWFFFPLGVKMYKVSIYCKKRILLEVSDNF